MMPYEIVSFVIPNAKYQRERFTFKCQNYELVIDLSQPINVHIYIYIYIYFFFIYSKFIVIGNVWFIAILETKQILWDLNAVVMWTIFSVPLNLHTR